MAMRKFMVHYVPYTRYCDDEIPSFRIYTEKTWKDALVKIIDKHGYPLDEDEIEEMTENELSKHVTRNNGDGCDYIISIIEITDAIVIFDAEHQN